MAVAAAFFAVAAGVSSSDAAPTGCVGPEVFKSCGLHVPLSDLPLVFKLNTNGIPSDLRRTDPIPGMGTLIEGAITRSMAAWEAGWPAAGAMPDPRDVPAGCRALCFAGSTSAIAGVRDGINTIQFGDPSSCEGTHFVAVACSWYRGSSGPNKLRIEEVDIILRPTTSWSQVAEVGVERVGGEVTGMFGGNGGDSLDVQSTLTHEFGHALGLEDIGTLDPDDRWPGRLEEALPAQQTMYRWGYGGATDKRTPNFGDYAGLAYTAALSASDPS